jgi:hypothetical protein
MSPGTDIASHHSDSEPANPPGSRPDSKLSQTALADSSIHTRTGENKTVIWFRAVTPLVLHFLSVITLTLILKFCIYQQDFNLHSRKALSNRTPLQSDITTAVSAGVTIIRFIAATWSAAMLWRCIFILMENGGISLRQINSLLTWQIHFYPCLKSSQKTGLLVSIILLLSFPCQLSGPILTGSIIWSSSYGFVGGGKMGVPSGHIGDWSNEQFLSVLPLNFSSDRHDLYLMGAQGAAGYSTIAWQGSRNDSGTMKRVLDLDSELPINSTLNNITLPYFAVSKLEWIKDPISELSPTILHSSRNLSDWNPFYLKTILPGTYVILPDAWGVVSPLSPDSGIVSETRYLIGKVGFLGWPCYDSPALANLSAGLYEDPQEGCFIFGRVTYVAGAAECRKCRMSSWITVQNDTELAVSPDNTATYALAMMPKVIGLMGFQTASFPGETNLDKYVTEILVRSYGASWTILTSIMTGVQNEILLFETDVQIAVPTSRANILWWRVSLWLLLNLLFTLSGLLFLFVQRTSNGLMIGNPSMAALLLDTTEVHHKQNRALCDFSDLVEADERIQGYLHLQKSEEGHKYVEVIDCQ